MRNSTSGYANLLVLLTLGLAGCASTPTLPFHLASAQPKTPATVAWTDFHDHPAGYLNVAQLPDARDFLPPPPSPDSPKGQADLAIYLSMKALEDTPRWSQAKADADVETPTAPKAFACALGAAVTPQTAPRLSLLLARVMMDVSKAEDAAKAAYARHRPFLTDNGETCVAKEDWLVKQGSYPSGHAATGWAWALILSELDPGRAEAVMNRGMSYGESRVVCRVHYESDVEAGRLVGSAVVARLHSDPAFIADLKRAKTELAAARISTPPHGCTPTMIARGER